MMQNIPATLWSSEVLHLPTSLAGAHQDFLNEKGWMALYDPKISGAVGGSSFDEAKEHVINRFLNSAARMQYVCADPKCEQLEIRQMVLDQLGDGHIFLLDIAAGNGAGTLAILSLICELRLHRAVPKLPLNVSILAVDYSVDALNFYAELRAKICPWLETQGVTVSLLLEPCDLTIAGEFSEALDAFFEDAKSKKVNRFLAVISAVSGVGKEKFEQIQDSLKLAAARLSHSKLNSSWLWVEPPVGKSWLTIFVDVLKHIMQKIQYSLLKSGNSYSIKSGAELLSSPSPRKFVWHDPHQSCTATSFVTVMSFKNK
jgi:hypothetical protein